MIDLNITYWKTWDLAQSTVQGTVGARSTLQQGKSCLVVYSKEIWNKHIIHAMKWHSIFRLNWAFQFFEWLP